MLILVEIDIEYIEKIFEHGFTTKTDGHGFGLKICQHYMSKMNGKIWAESKGVGKGTTMVLEFPKTMEIEK